ncbi:Peptidase family U32 [uncultured archaeon]|nr:Peptidase family U32 [uncultured archaeon]
MPKIELLAPAGNPTTLKAAVESGADAVYMGSNVWNARLRARNFTNEELAKAIAYCHKNSVKAYVTLNTMLSEPELPGVAEYIRFIYDKGADAVIVQDLAAARMARETGDDMEIHASTQLSVHNSKTARMLKNQGLKRIVLARELSIDQAKRIKENAGMPVEVFCHGALCYSYSGKCLWSYYQTGRSGNRGACAQLCRFPWKMLCDGKLVEKGYLTSTKDLNLLEKMPEIAISGIDCVKIEGRLKDARYVRETVAAYRAAIDWKEPKLIKPALRGYTTGYLFGEARREKLTNPKSQQYAGEKVGEVTKVYQDGAIVKLSGKLKVGELIRATSSGKHLEVYRMFNLSNKEIKESKTECMLKIKTLKRGDVIFKVEKAEVDEEFLKPIKAESARTGKLFAYSLEKLDFSKAPNLFFPNNRDDIGRVPSGSACVVDWIDANERTFGAIKRAGGKVVVDTPRVIFDGEMPAAEKKMEELSGNVEAFMVSEPSLVSGHPTVVSHYANVSNTLAARAWMGFGNVTGIVSSIEVPQDKAKEIGFLPFTGKNVELVVSENNLFRELGLKDNSNCMLVDPRGNHFPVRLVNGRTVVMCPAIRKEKKKERRARSN